MPKDKKSGEKEGSSNSKEAELVKRKNSVVDSSSSSNSSSSSTSSSSSENSSEHSSEIGDDYDNEKGTMTGGNETKNSTGKNCQVLFRDRTDEMRRLMEENSAETRPVQIVNEENSVPVSSDTHIVPIAEAETSLSPTSSSSVASSSSQPKKQSALPQARSSKPGQKQKQLTKKERKALEKKRTGEVIQRFPGQKSRTIVNEVESAIGNNPLFNNFQVHHFEEVEDCVQDGEMIMQAKNSTAKAVFGDKPVAVPFFRDETYLGPPMEWTDLHQNSQHRYLKNHPIGPYTDYPADVKLQQRMGFGIAGSGIADSEILTLSVGGAKHVQKHEYQDYVASASKIINWHLEFSSQCDMDQKNRYGPYSEVMSKLLIMLTEIEETLPTNYEGVTLKALREGTVRDVLLCFGELERSQIRYEQMLRSKDLIGVNDCSFRNVSRKDGLQNLVTGSVDFSTKDYIVTGRDGEETTCCASILMYLASQCPGDEPCYKMDHKKCTLLQVLLRKSKNRTKHLNMVFEGGYNLLHFAAMTGAPCQVDVLLRDGVPMNALNNHFRSPLALSLRRQCNLISRQFLWHGADIGGALTLVNVQPRNQMQSEDKNLAEEMDDVANLMPYKAYDYIQKRIHALNDTFVSWVEALLLDSEPRLKLTVADVKSSLHQIRIGRAGDETVQLMPTGEVWKKKIPIAIERCFERNGPVMLFLIPAKYNRFDSTMPAEYPHIVRVSMINNGPVVATECVHKEVHRRQEGLPREDNFEEIRRLRPYKVLSQPPILHFYDTYSNSMEILECPFANEHNGMYYAYMIPPHLIEPKNNDEKEYARFTLEININAKMDTFLGDAFFMAQVIRIGKIADEEPKDPRYDEIAHLVALRRADLNAKQFLNSTKDSKVFDEEPEKKLQNETAKREREQQQQRERDAAVATAALNAAARREGGLYNVNLDETDNIVREEVQAARAKNAKILKTKTE